MYYKSYAVYDHETRNVEVVFVAYSKEQAIKKHQGLIYRNTKEMIPISDLKDMYSYMPTHIYWK